MYLRLTFTAEGENFQPKKFLKDFDQESILANYDKDFLELIDNCETEIPISL